MSMESTTAEMESTMGMEFSMGIGSTIGMESTMGVVPTMSKEFALGMAWGGSPLVYVGYTIGSVLCIPGPRSYPSLYCSKSSTKRDTLICTR